MEKNTTTEVLDLDQIGSLLFRSASDGIMVVDKNGVMQLVNPSISEMFEYPVEDIIGQKVEMLVPSLQQNGYSFHLNNRPTSSSSQLEKRGMDVRGKRKNGSTFPIQISLSPFTYERKPWVMAILTKAPQRLLLLEELRKERQMAQRYLDTASTLFVLINKAHEIELINKRGCDILGYKEKEILGKNWFQNFIPNDQKEEVEKVFESLMNGDIEGYRHYQNFIVNKNGEKRLIDWNNVVIQEDGNIAGTLSSGMDITKQREAELELIELYNKLEQRVKERTNALEERHQLYKSIAHHFPNGDINVLDHNLNYVFAEGTGIYSRGFTGDMLIGTSFLKHLDPIDREPIRDALKSVFDGQNTRFEIEINNDVYMVSAVGLPDLGDEIKQILVVSQNITSLKRAEEQVQLSLQKEMNLNELKSRFVSMASHEFRTPLTSILNSTSLIDKYIGKEEYEQKQRNHINRIKRSVHNLTNILNDFLSLDKLEQGKLDLRVSEFDIFSFSEKIIEELDGIKKQGQQIHYEHGGPREVCMDVQMLKNIFNNLMSNAIKYSPEDSNVYLHTWVKKNELWASFKDEGIGIPEEEKTHLFERFYRAKNALNIQGTGLGLNIVKKYIDMTGGDIEFESENGKGTTFTIKVPLLQPLNNSQHEEKNRFN